MTKLATRRNRAFASKVFGRAGEDALDRLGDASAEDALSAMAHWVATGHEYGAASVAGLVIQATYAGHPIDREGSVADFIRSRAPQSGTIRDGLLMLAAATEGARYSWPEIDAAVERSLAQADAVNAIIDGPAGMTEN